ncbi:MAG: transposase family protein, partial [Candidatus Binataceae bacterium]
KKDIGDRPTSLSELLPFLDPCDRAAAGKKLSSAAANIPAAPITDRVLGLSKLPERAVAIAVARAELLERRREWPERAELSKRENHAAFVTALKISNIKISVTSLRLLPKVSARTLSRWFTAYKRDGLRGLAPKYHRCPETSRPGGMLLPAVIARPRAYLAAHPDISAWLVARDLKYSNRASINQITLGARAEFGERAPSRAQVLRFLQVFRRERQVERAYVQEANRAPGRFGAAFGDRSAGITEFLQKVELDGSPCDILTLSGRRQVIILTDVFTRMRWTVIAPSESTDSTARLFVKVMTTIGVPKCVRTDFGAGFTSARMRGFLADLGVEFESTEAPYRGDLKPFVESSVRYIQRVFGLFEGFTGHNVAHRQQMRDRVSLKDRRGKTEADLLDVRMTDADLEAALDKWLAEIFGNTAIAGRTPNHRLADWIAGGGRVNRISDVGALSALLMDGAVRTVGKAGLRIDGALFCAPELGAWIGRPVWAARHYDLGRIVVLTADQGARDFICVAENVDRLGARRRDVALAAKAIQRQRINAVRKESRALLGNYRTPLGEAILSAVRDGAGTPEIPHDDYVTPALDAASRALAQIESLDHPAPAPIEYSDRAEIDAEYSRIMKDLGGPELDLDGEVDLAVTRFRALMAAPRDSWTEDDALFVGLAAGLPEIKAMIARGELSRCA